ncbi:MAG: type VI secretion protein ImpB [Alphaproteobacteria bacterium]|nr:type VI secretion protein ImpB [Alphaproteobacteria bacterium]MBV9695209.1 type VI secretion protein ImpB [Alphaproteobacteria bacterium]
MRKAATIEKLYLDFDGFFASVMQQAMPHLRGRPVGVIPFETDKPDSTMVIACSKEAKAAGCKNVMGVPEARAICPDIVLVTQRPDLFRRAHNALLNEISCEIPIETVKSIDELACKLDSANIADPRALAKKIKDRLRRNIGEQITCSIGFAANRLLAKIACKVDKPNGVTVWRPEDLPDPLFALPLESIPGVGSRMEERLKAASILTIRDLWHAQPKHLRALWGNVNGERMWYALHGYDIHAMPTSRGMYGHGRVLPPDWRDAANAQSCSRLLLTKAARRMRRDRYYAAKLWLSLDMRDGTWSGQRELPAVQDDHACLVALTELWITACAEIPPRAKIIRLSVTLGELSSANERQLDLFLRDDAVRQKNEVLTNAMDNLNRKFGKRVVSLGPWTPPPGGYAGGKISYNRIPSAEDFW